MPKSSIDTDIKAIRDNAIPDFRYRYDDYLQYSPAAVMLGMKAFGYESRSGWGRMLVADAFSVAIMAGVVNGLKYSVKRMRPDESRRNSFPSGHTATAFMTATMLHKEYGWRSPWFSIGGYTAAAVTGVSRIMNDRHWMSDVVAGAAVGIGAVHLGYFLSDLIFKDKHLAEGYERPVMYSDRSSRVWTAGLFFSRKFILGASAISRGGQAGVSLEMPVTPRIGAGLRTSVCSLSGSSSSRNVYNALAGVVYNYPFCRLFEAGAHLLAGGAWAEGNGCGFDTAAGVSISILTGSNFRIKAFAEYELLASARQKPLNSVNIGYSAAFRW